MKSIRKIIIFIISIIVVLILILFGIKFRENIKNKENVEEEYVPENEITKVYNNEEFYNIKLIFQDIQEYINYLDYSHFESKYEFTDSESTTNGLKEKGIESIKGIIDENYMKEYNVTDDIIYNNFVKFSNKKIRINNIYVCEQNLRIKTYFVYASDIETNNELKLVINTDDSNCTFNIMLEDYFNKNNISEENIEEKKININIEEIEENNYNKYEYYTISDKDYTLNIYQDYMDIIKYNPEKAYEILDNEYKQKRFYNLDKFNEFIEQNDFSNGEYEITKYKLNKKDNYTEYICIDQYGNYYIFKDKGVMDYTVMLDTYTIDSDEFNNKYNNGSEQLKVGMNLEKIFQALNRKDYNYIYEKLDDNFKQNNFPTLTDFETYAKSTFFDINKIEYGDFEEKSGVYVYKISLSDATESANEEKKVMKNFIVKLEDNNDFKMAFNVD